MKDIGAVEMDYSPLWISIKVAVLATIATFMLGLLAARWVLSLNKLRFVVDGIFSLPMVLPPTVVGFFCSFYSGKIPDWDSFLCVWD